MSNSPLVQVTVYSPNHSGARNQPISKITVHHMAGVMSAEQCGRVFRNTSRQASSNYGIGNDGKVGLYVDEANRAWTSSNAWNDNRAVTIETSNCATGDPWPVSEAAWKSLVRLCADICRRNPGIKRADGRPGLHYTGDKDGSLTEHRMFAATGCPGQYLHERMQKLCDEVNAELDGATETAIGTHIKPTTGFDRQRWVLEPDGEFYRLRNVATGLYLDVKDGATAHRTPVRAHKGNGSRAQLWQLDIQDRAVDKWAYLRSALAPNMTLACSGGSTAPGTGTVIGTWDGAPAQKWCLVWAGQLSTYYLVNLLSGMALAVD